MSNSGSPPHGSPMKGGQDTTDQEPTASINSRNNEVSPQITGVADPGEISNPVSIPSTLTAAQPSTNLSFPKIIRPPSPQPARSPVTRRAQREIRAHTNEFGRISIRYLCRVQRGRFLDVAARDARGDLEPGREIGERFTPFAGRQDKHGLPDRVPASVIRSRGGGTGSLRRGTGEQHRKPLALGGLGNQLSYQRLRQFARQARHQSCYGAVSFSGRMKGFTVSTEIRATSTRADSMQAAGVTPSSVRKCA